MLSLILIWMMIMSGAYVMYILYLIYEFRRRSPTRPFVTCIFDAICYFPQSWKLFWWAEDNDIHIATKDAICLSGLNDFGESENGDFIKKYEVARKVGVLRSKAKVRNIQLIHIAVLS